MLNRFLAFLAVTFVFTVGLNAQARIQLEGEGKALDFGDVYAGSKLVHDVTIKNVGKDTLRISDVHAQCGCTATLLQENTIAPDGSTRMTVTFDSKNYPPGKVTKHVYITSNDTSQPLSKT